MTLVQENSVTCRTSRIHLAVYHVSPRTLKMKNKKIASIITKVNIIN